MHILILIVEHSQYKDTKMKFYKNKQDELFFFPDNITEQEIIREEKNKNTILTQLTFSEYTALLKPSMADINRSRIQTAKQSQIKSDLQSYLKSYTLADGTVIENSMQDQANNLKNLALSQLAMQSPKWSASVSVALNDVVFIGTTLCLCTTAGTTGASAPTAPADFSTALTDNTAVWKKLGFLVNTGKGRVYFTPQDIIKISQEVAFILNEALTKYDSLKTQIAACKTQADLDRIIWS